MAMPTAGFPEAERPQFKLTPKQDRARDMLISDARHCALGGGSRSGKTFLLVRQIILRAMKADNSRHAIFRFRFNALKATIIADTLPKVMRLCFPNVQYDINKTDWFMTLPNGSEVWFGGLDDKERTEKILGMEFATIYFNECSQIPWQSVVLARTRLAQKTPNLALKAFYDFNPPSKMHWSYLFFVEKKEPMDKVPLANPASVSFMYINPMDNVENLDPATIEELESLPEAARKRFLLGQFADDSEGAYWTVELLAQNRKLGGELDPTPDFLRIVVAVDPSGCSGPEDKRSDEIGITVCALGTDGHGYLIEDLSGRYKPEEWGQVAVDAYFRHEADCIVGEVNFGGDMVRSTIHAAEDGAGLPYKEVRASRGKVVRAEPIASLYEQGKIHHIGNFAMLEDQLCGFLASGYIGHGSPDRADSAIWGFTELFPRMTRKKTSGGHNQVNINTNNRSKALDRTQRRPTRRMNHEVYRDPTVSHHAVKPCPERGVWEAAPDQTLDPHELPRQPAPRGQRLPDACARGLPGPSARRSVQRDQLRLGLVHH